MTELALGPWLIEATLEIFETMVCSRIEAGTPSIDGESPAAHVVGAVGFLGSLRGTVSFYCSNDVARDIAGLLLGIEPAEAESQVPDTVGEITNMIAGRLRGRMAQHGETVMITTPTVTRGTDFSAQHFNIASRILCPFRMGSQELFVELILQAA
jgi:chemotaxis protein CheX